MAKVADLSEPYGNFMLAPRPGAGVCEVCFDLTDGHDRCYSCRHSPRWLDAVAPISYSVAHEQLHHALAGYKRAPARIARKFEVELAAVLWRFLAAHEPCVALASGIGGFEIVTTVPSSSMDREPAHPLPRLVGELVGPTRTRYRRLLRRSTVEAAPHTPCAERFEPTQTLNGAMKSAGARVVAAVVIGRHLNRHHGGNHERLNAIPTPFDWGRCAFHVR